MKSEIILPERKIKAEGRVTIEYTNGITGETEAKFQSKNFAFPGSFARVNNFAFANNTDYSPFCLFVSDKGDNVNYDLPFVPGNIIGYGYPGSTAQGYQLGAENVEARSLGIYSEGMWHYKRQWSWLPTQIKSEIKSFGLTSIAATGSSYDERGKWAMSVNPPPVNFAGDVSNNGWHSYDTGFCYALNSYLYFSTNKISDFGCYVNVYSMDQPQKQTYRKVYLRDLIPMPSNVRTRDAYFGNFYGHGIFAFDIDTGDILIVILYRGTDDAPYVQISRLDPALTTLKSNTVYSCGTYSSPDSSQFPFSGWGATEYASVGYYSEGKISVLYGKYKQGVAQLATIDPNMWDASGNFLDAFTFDDTYLDYLQYWPRPYSVGFSVKNKTPLFWTYYGSHVNTPTQQTSHYLMIVVDPKKHKPYATRSMHKGGSNHYYFAMPFYEIVNGNVQMLQHVYYYYGNSSDPSYINNETNYYRNVGDLTLYVLPDSAPKREEGQGVTITYEIAWGYE